MTPLARNGDYRAAPFRPAPWILHPHLQTVLGKFLRPRIDPGLRRERIATPDGDFLDLDFMPDPGPDRPVVLILHGLEGSTRRGYVRVLMRELAERQILAVGLNFRSCSGEPNLRPRFYHSGETGDAALVLKWLAARFPGRPLGLAGFSLGGNVALKLLGEAGGRGPTPVRAAVAISVPFDLVAGTRAIESGTMGRVYTHYFLKSLLAKTEAKVALLAPVIDLERVRRARTLREFDDAATAPLHGFPGSAAYYRESSSARFLGAIRTPTLLLQAADDPFLPREALPEQTIAGNPHLVPAFVPRGGHVGFVGGSRPWRPVFWAEREAARFLAATLPGRHG